MSSLKEWFKSRNEESAINKIVQHVLKCIECVVEFEKAISFLIEEKKVDLALKVFFRVNELENQADQIRRDILNTISQADLTSVIRENLTHLVKRIDDVANATNACARILVYMNHTDFEKLGESVHKDILKMTQQSVECVKLLNVMVRKIIHSENRDEIKEIAGQISFMEHQIDETHFAINRNLVSHTYDINPFSAIEIHKCFIELENISDNAEEVADYLVMLDISKRI